jgi:hypothetical protein
LRTGKEFFVTAEVIDTDFKHGHSRVKFHFTKVPEKFDEWIEVPSDRVAPLNSRQLSKGEIRAIKAQKAKSMPHVKAPDVAKMEQQAKPELKNANIPFDNAPDAEKKEKQMEIKPEKPDIPRAESASKGNNIKSQSICPPLEPSIIAETLLALRHSAAQHGTSVSQNHLKQGIGSESNERAPIEMKSQIGFSGPESLLSSKNGYHCLDRAQTENGALLTAGVIPRKPKDASQATKLIVSQDSGNEELKAFTEAVSSIDARIPRKTLIEPQASNPEFPHHSSFVSTYGNYTSSSTMSHYSIQKSERSPNDATAADTMQMNGSNNENQHPLLGSRFVQKERK